MQLYCLRAGRRYRPYWNRCSCASCTAVRDVAMLLDTPPEVVHRHSRYEYELSLYFFRYYLRTKGSEDLQSLGSIPRSALPSP